MKEYLESIGVVGAENLAARLLFAVWTRLDWQTPLWKSAGADCYDRFKTRAASAARERTIQAFQAALARRCHVMVPQLEAVDVSDLQTANAGDVLAILRKETSLLVAYMRLWIEERRAFNNPQSSLFGGK